MPSYTYVYQTFDQDLSQPVAINYLKGNLYSQDYAANAIGVNCFYKGQPNTLTGTVSANIIRADGSTVVQPQGIVSGNNARVTLPAAAYAVPGPIVIAIKLNDGTRTTTLCCVAGNVVESETESTVDPGTILPSIQDLIAQIQAAVDSIPLDYGNLSRTVELLTDGVAEEDYTPETITITRTSGYINLSGQVQSSDTYEYTQKISVHPGDIVRLTNANYTMRFVTAYSGENAVSAKGAETTVKYVVPADIDGVILSIRTVDTNARVIVDRKGYKNNLQDEMDLILIKEAPENVYTGSMTVGEQVATSNGAFVEGEGYARSTYIPIKAGTVNIGVQSNSTLPTVFVHAAFYDANKNFVSGATYTGYTVQTENDLRYQTLTAPQDGFVAYDVYSGNAVLPMYVSQIASPIGYVEPSETTMYINPAMIQGGNTDIMESMTYGKTPGTAKKSTFSDGETMKVETNSIMKNNVISFYAKVTSFNEILIGHGTGDYGKYIKVDNTNITYMSNGAAIGSPVAHGLTISDYISVIIKIAYTGATTVIVNTLGGIKTHNGGTWTGRRGDIFATNNGSALTNAELIWNCDDYKMALWAFGDSYFTINATDRWTFYPVVSWGYDTMLMNAYPGEASENAYNDLIAALKHGTPKYLLWCLGMNDHDTTAVNSTWLEAVEAIEVICQQKGIELILATIPDVTNPSYNNTYKNAWVRSSGHRYVDFAGAVDGVSGWLSDDGVHPTALGARLLAVAAIKGCPEILQK